MKNQLYLSPYRILFLVVTALTIGLYLFFTGINNVYYNRSQMKIAIAHSDFATAEKYYLAGVPKVSLDAINAHDHLYIAWITYLVDQNEIELANTMARDQNLKSKFADLLEQNIKRNYVNNSKLPTKSELTLIAEYSDTYQLFEFFLTQEQYDTARQIAMMSSYYSKEWLKKVDEAQSKKPRKK